MMERAAWMSGKYGLMVHSLLTGSVVESDRKAADINPAAEAATWNLGIFFQNRRIGIATAN